MNKNEIIQFIENDTRTQAEIFDSMRRRIQNRSKTPMSDIEATNATHRLIGFFETFVDKPRADFTDKFARDS